MFVPSTVVATNIYVNNNIVNGSLKNCLYWINTFSGWANVTLTNNLYNQASGNMIEYNNGTGYTRYTMAQFATYQSEQGKDQNSKAADPLFVSPSHFHLQTTSPAINAGTNVGLTTDYEGETVPFGAAPDIGAYEYNSGFLELQPPTRLRVVP